MAYEEEDTCICASPQTKLTQKEEDTCMAYEEEDTCICASPQTRRELTQEDLPYIYIYICI